jgi:hypothetical protein
MHLVGVWLAGLGVACLHFSCMQYRNQSGCLHAAKGHGEGVGMAILYKWSINNAAYLSLLV